MFSSLADRPSLAGKTTGFYMRRKHRGYDEDASITGTLIVEHRGCNVRSGIVVDRRR
jgi:hypothetical protein